MSRNFELLERAGVAREITSVIAPKPAPTLVPQTGNGQRHEAGLNLDRIAREECLKLVQRVFLMQTDSSSRAVVFAGIDRGNGCSRTCASAAQVLAENVPGSVCVVDANLHAPALARFFGVANHNGLADSVLSQGLIRRFTQQLRPDNLSLLSCGAASGENANLLNSDRLTTWMKALREEFDYVLIDAPPAQSTFRRGSFRTARRWPRASGRGKFDSAGIRGESDGALARSANCRSWRGLE